MKTLLYCFYLLMCCGAAEGFTEKSVDLGQNVTLKCEVAVKDLYWFLMKPSEPPVFILRSFTSKMRTPEYSNPTFNKSFSLQYNSSLFIHNISTNELGVYYCVQTGSPHKISSGIRLYIQNHSAENQTCNREQQHSNEDWDLRESSLLMILITSVIINVVLAIAVTVCHCRRRLKTRAPPEPGIRLPQDNQDSDGPVYSDVLVTPMNTAIRTNNINSTYALLKPRNRDPE